MKRFWIKADDAKRILSRGPLSDNERRECYSVMRRAGLLHGTIARAMDLAARRCGNRPWHPQLEETRSARQALLRARHRIVVPLGEMEQRITEAARTMRPRVYRWDIPVASREHGGIWVRDICQGRYSAKCTFEKIDHQPQATSYGYIFRGTLVYQWLDQPPRRISAPRGWKWDRDRNGIRLVSLSDAKVDFHPTAHDLLADHPTRRCARQARELAVQRRGQRQLERSKKLTLVELRAQLRAETVFARMSDSRAAGNCPAGTASWCKRHSLNPRGSVPAYRLVDMVVAGETNGETDRVVAVARLSLRRHQQEMARGYCEL